MFKMCIYAHSDNLVNFGVTHMAEFAQFHMTWYDSDGRTSTVSPYVRIVDAKAFVAAADEAARAATLLGVMANAFYQLTAGTMTKYYVSFGQTTGDPLPASDDAIFRGNKIVVHYSEVDADNRFLTIPTRDDTVLTYAGTEITLDDAGNMAAFVTAFEAAAIGKNGGAVTVLSAEAND